MDPATLFIVRVCMKTLSVYSARRIFRSDLHSNSVRKQLSIQGYYLYLSSILAITRKTKQTIIFYHLLMSSKSTSDLTFITLFCYTIEQSQISHNALDKGPIKHTFVTEICTYEHVAATKWCIMGYRICELWNFCMGSIRILLLSSVPSF